MIWDILKVFTNVRSQQKLFADDNIDKLNRSTTVCLLVLSALFMTMRNYSGEQIECNRPSNTVDLEMSYVKSICWVKDSYLPSSYGDTDTISKGHKLNFYPWLPVVVFLLAFCFYIPYMLWKFIMRNSMYQHMPIDINGVVNLLKKSDLFDTQNFNRNIEVATAYLDKCFSINNYHDGFNDDLNDEEPESDTYPCKKLINKEPIKKLSYTKRGYVPLVLSYLLIKLLYLAISIGIFGLVDLALNFKSSFYLYGYNMMRDIYSEASINNNTAYLNSDYFPRVVFCYVHTINMGGHFIEAPIQCSLPSNFLNEKIFLFLWFWFCLMIVFNTYSLFKWVFILVLRRRYIEEMLTWPFKYKYNIRRYIKSFTSDYLRTEGFLVMMLVKSNTQDWHCRIIMRNLWKYYMNRQEFKTEIGSYQLTDQIMEENEEYFYQQHMNNKSPVSSQTLKCPYRRKLDLNDEALTPCSIIKSPTDADNKDEAVCKNVLFKLPNERNHMTEL